jgi:hypothetical protein
MCTLTLLLTTGKYKTTELSRVKNELTVLQMEPKSLMDSEKTKQHNSKSTNNNNNTIHVPYAVTTE